MQPIPTFRVRYARNSNAIGFMTQALDVTTDSFSTLFAVTGIEKTGLFFEQNTGSIMLQPVPIPRDFGDTVTQTSATGKWREVEDRPTGKKQMSQKDSTANDTDDWWVETSGDPYLQENAAFCVTFGMAPPPADATHDGTNSFRRIVWPYPLIPGQTSYRVTFAYGYPPRLEQCVDGASWTVIGNIPCTADLSSARHGRNARLTLTVLAMENRLVVWLGSEMNLRDSALVHKTPEIPAAGQLRVEGRNGACLVGFADMRFVREGYYVSARRRAPRRFAQQRPLFVFNAVQNTDQRITGTLEHRYQDRYEFTYRVTLRSPALVSDPEDPLAQYSASTPLMKAAKVIWPSLYRNPFNAGWRDIVETSRLESIQERLTFNLQTGLYSRQFRVTMENVAGEWRNLPGAQALEFWLGYAHTGIFLRGRGIGNTEDPLTSDGAVSHFSFNSEDLLFILSRQVIRDRIEPTGWCVYALIRLLLEHGQIVPGLQQRIINDIPGPLVQCGHTKFPPHPGWDAGTPVLACLADIREIIGGWFGQDRNGQFRFEEFNWELARRQLPAKRFQEVAGNAFGLPGGAMNEILSPAMRVRSLANVRNDISLIGFEQTTGRVFTTHLEDPDSKYNRLSPNYLGFTSPLIHLWTGYATEAFAEYSAQKIANRVTLPGESVLLTTWGQPNLYPGDTFWARDRRTLGYAPIKYFCTDMVSTWRPDGTYTSEIGAIWTGTGVRPGAS